MAPDVVITLLIMFGLCSFVPLMFIIDHFRYSKRPFFLEFNMYVDKLQEEGVPAKPVGPIPMVIISDFDMENVYISE